MITDAQALDALKTLITLCEEHDKCEDCLLRNNNSFCGVLWRLDDEGRETLSEIKLINYQKPQLILN